MLVRSVLGSRVSDTMAVNPTYLPTSTFYLTLCMLQCNGSTTVTSAGASDVAQNLFECRDPDSAYIHPSIAPFRKSSRLLFLWKSGFCFRHSNLLIEIPTECVTGTVLVLKKNTLLGKKKGEAIYIYKKDISEMTCGKSGVLGKEKCAHEC